MKTIAKILFGTLFFVVFSCSKSDDNHTPFDYGVNCDLVNCVKEVDNASGTLMYLGCFDEYGVVTSKTIDGVEYQDAGIIEDIDESLTQDLPKSVTFSGLYIEKEYPLQFPDPSFNMDRVDQLLVKELKLD